MSTIKTRDNADIFYVDWGEGQPVVFSHGWPLNADAWEEQLFFFASHGYRVIAHDRRGHGRSTRTWHGNEMNTYADDLSQLLEQLRLNDAILIGHSTGGGEVARYIGRHGSSRIAKVALIGAVTPSLLKTHANPEGVPIEAMDALRAAVARDRSHFFRDFSAQFYGSNRDGSDVSQGVHEQFWRLSMQTGLAAALQCIQAFSETDFTEDLLRIDVPTLLLHGDDDQVVPFWATATRAEKLIPNALLKLYPRAPHGLMTTHRDQFNADLLEFIRS
jgi:non-heme chloroperoxidase